MHTPGPWIYYADLPSTEPNWHIVTTVNKMRVLANVHIEPGNAVDEANARLIAAAPELLAALKAQLAYEAAPTGSTGRLNWMELVKVRDAAIAKAEGKADAS